MAESTLSILLDTRRAAKGDQAGIERRQRARLGDMVTYARANSTYYRDLYKDLPDRVSDASLLPVTDKKTLMARFDDWVTDAEATLDKARAFAADPARIGDQFLDRYVLATTSGTTGTPGVFLIDDRALAVTNAMMLRMLGAWLRPRDVLRIVRGGARTSLVLATGGHFASAVAAARLQKSGRVSERLQVLSVHMPLDEIVAALNRFQPAVVAPYASVAALLADEQAAGRLNIRPVLLVLAAEGLPQPEYARIAQVFAAKVGNSYACTECMHLSQCCSEGWLHVNSDWAVLEPVDADHRPVPAGEPSHTVLLSNLANRVQPILRYDLGDRITVRPDPCPCGSPLPAIRVEGRTGEAIRFPRPDGRTVSLSPLTFAALEDRVPGLRTFQIVQRAPDAVAVRAQAEPGADPEQVRAAALRETARLLAEHGLEQVVAVERDDQPPEKTKGGKFRAVVPLED